MDNNSLNETNETTKNNEVLFDTLKQNELKSICDYFSDMLPEEFILEQAEKNIQSVVYKDMNGGMVGNYNFVKKEITIDTRLSEDAKKVAVMHEMLHAITYRSESSRGFKRLNPILNVPSQGIGLDEAITEELAQRITGVKNEKTYASIRVGLLMFSKAIGEDAFIKDYMLGTNKAEREMNKKFGPDVLKLYHEISGYLDDIALYELNIGHLTKDQPNYEQLLETLNSKLKKVNENYPKKAREFMDLCMKIHKEKNEKENEKENGNRNINININKNMKEDNRDER